MSAVRVARAATKRDKIVKFEGLLSRPRRLVPGAGGIRRDDARRADEPRRPGRGGGRHAARALQRSRLGATRVVDRHRGQIAAIFVEPIAGNMGVVPPRDGFLDGLREICDREGHPARLRRSDLRLPRGDRRGAADLRGPPGPDLPRQDHRRRAAGGRLRRTRRHHGAGRAGGAGLPGGDAVRQPARDDGRDSGRSRSSRRGSTGTWRSSARNWPPGLADAARDAGVPLQVNAFGSLLTPFFTSQPVRDYQSALHVGHGTRTAAFFRGMLARGIYPPPSQFEAWFLSGRTRRATSRRR